MPFLPQEKLLMRQLADLLVLAILASVCGNLATAADSPRPRRRPNPALAPITDVAGLPRVLLIGDSISIGYTTPTRKLLEGKANVHRIPTNGGPTTRGIEQLDAWLGDSNWDVIHFNWGLHDLKHIDSKGGLTDVDKGPVQVPLDAYRKNLQALVKRLQQTGAELVWCSTTPVPQGAKGRVTGDEVRYNAAAAEVMQEAGIEINDLYASALPKLATIGKPADVHYTTEGSAELASQVADAITAALQRRASNAGGK